eukprot:m.62444 g.62444  ORF g.62444 m.62444 type:complete len:65 (-) comp9612_c0_seq4:600-794(-)
MSSEDDTGERPSSKATERITAYLESSGVAVTDVPLAIVVHETMSFTLLFGVCHLIPDAPSFQAP